MALGRRGSESGETAAMTAVNRDQEADRGRVAGRDATVCTRSTLSLSSARPRLALHRPVNAGAAIPGSYRLRSTAAYGAELPIRICGGWLELFRGPILGARRVRSNRVASSHSAIAERSPIRGRASSVKSEIA